MNLPFCKSRPPQSGGFPQSNKSRLREFSFGVFLSVAALLLVLLFTEVVLRLWGYTGSKGRLVSVHDLSLSEVRRSHWIFKADFNKPTVRIAGKDVRKQRDDGAVRILFIGDSGTEGVGVQPQEAFPRKLEALLRANKTTRQIEVINAAVRGMSTVNELNFYKQHLSQFQPDLIVLGVFLANDISFSLVHRRYLESGAKPLSQKVFDLLEQRSALFHYLSLRLLVLLERHRQDMFFAPAQKYLSTQLQLVDENGVAMTSYRAAEVATYRASPSAMIEKAYRVVRHSLGEFAALAQQNGATLVLCLLPSPSTVEGKMRFRRAADYRAEDPVRGAHSLDLDAPRKRLKKYAEEFGFTAIDPTDALRRAPVEVFLSQNNHFNEAGHAIIAEELVGEIQHHIAHSLDAANVALSVEQHR